MCTSFSVMALGTLNGFFPNVFFKFLKWFGSMQLPDKVFITIKQTVLRLDQNPGPLNYY